MHLALSDSVPAKKIIDRLHVQRDRVTKTLEHFVQTPYVENDFLRSHRVKELARNKRTLFIQIHLLSLWLFCFPAV